MAFAKAQPLLRQLADAFTPEEEAAYVFPNRRALRQFEAWLPTGVESRALYTVDQLFQTLSGAELLDTDALLVAFYGSYQKLYADGLAFGDFASWAVPMLSDFNDVDLFDADAGALFKSVLEYRDAGTTPRQAKDGSLEKQFEGFWQRIPALYAQFRADLLHLKLGYRGLLYRQVADMCKANKLEAEALKGKTCHWVGIVPGNGCEKALMAWMERNGRLHRYADVDEYYLRNKAMPAARLFTEIADTLRPTNLLGTTEKELHLHPQSSLTAQFEAASSLAAPEIAFVVADQKLADPLEKWCAKKNIAVVNECRHLLANTRVHQLVMACVKMHSEARRTGLEFKFTDVDSLMNLLHHAGFISAETTWQPLRKASLKNNKVFVEKREIADAFGRDLFAASHFQVFFDWPSQPSESLNEVMAVVKCAEKILDLPSESHECDEYARCLRLVASQFGALAVWNSHLQLANFLEMRIGNCGFYRNHCASDAPVIISLADTRMLDFESVVFIGASDDALPGNTALGGFIPQIHRAHFGLPTWADTEGLMAYHFYRLITRSRRVHFIYSVQPTELLSGELSRYALQMKHHLAAANDGIVVIEHEAPPWQAHTTAPIEIIKTPELLAKLKQQLARKISASSINKYVDNPLTFYLSYILQIEEEVKLAEVIEAREFGTVVHGALEALYKPFVNEKLGAADVEKMLPMCDEAVRVSFAETMGEAAASGENFTELELAKLHTAAFLKADAAELREHGAVTILGIEELLTATFSYPDVPIRFIGFADRIDERNGVVRVIDYKSGKVENTDLTADAQAMITNSKKGKALQLLIYQWLVSRKWKRPMAEVQPMIYSFANTQAGYMPLKTEEKADAVFETVIHSLMSEMFDSSVPFAAKASSRYAHFG